MLAFTARIFTAAIPAAFAVLLLAGCSNSGSGAPANLVKTVTLSGAEENPPVTTAAAGTGSFTFDLNSGAVSGSVNTFGITANAAHIHEGAVGVNAPVIVPLTQDAPGVWSVPPGMALSPSQLDSLRAGNLYVNVHSTANPGGEIRGQMTK